MHLYLTTSATTHMEQLVYKNNMTCVPESWVTADNGISSRFKVTNGDAILGSHCDGTTNEDVRRNLTFDNSNIVDNLSNSFSDPCSSQRDSVVTAINLYANSRSEINEELHERHDDAICLETETSTLAQQGSNEVLENGIHEDPVDESSTVTFNNQDSSNEMTLLSSCVPEALLCPPGFQALLDAGQLVVHLGNLRHDYIFNVRCEKRMEVINELRRVQFYAEEEPSQSEAGSFMFKLYNKDKQEVAQVFCPASHTCLLCGLSWLWFKSCRFQAVVYCPPGVISGFVRQERTCLVQEFQILNAREEVILRLRGAPTDLEIYSVDLQHGIGRLSVHGWVGVMHEIRRTANDYGLTFPVDLDVRVKGLLMASVFAIDWLYRTKGGRR